MSAGLQTTGLLAGATRPPNRVRIVLEVEVQKKKRAATDREFDRRGERAENRDASRALHELCRALFELFSHNETIRSHHQSSAPLIVAARHVRHSHPACLPEPASKALDSHAGRKSQRFVHITSNRWNFSYGRASNAHSGRAGVPTAPKALLRRRCRPIGRSGFEPLSAAEPAGSPG